MYNKLNNIKNSVKYKLIYIEYYNVLLFYLYNL